MALLTEAQSARAVRLTPARLLRFLRDMIRYAAASVFALALDYGVLIALTTGFGVGYLQAAAAGFLSGLALIYVLSVRFVFEGRRARAPRIEMFGFLATGVVGLGVTEVMMHIFVGEFGLPLTIAKISTAGLVFLFNFVSRRGLLFKTASA
jgi:putative flippase GtrA